jgi:hypothetical protein
MSKTKWMIAILCSISIMITIGTPIASSRSHQLISFKEGDYFPEPPPWRDLLPSLLLAKTALAITNSILLTILLINYVRIYKTTRSQFSLGLIIFSVALLLYSLTSNPLIHTLAGFRLSGLGPFTLLPDLFTCIASAILLYLSQQ